MEMASRIVFEAVASRTSIHIVLVSVSVDFFTKSGRGRAQLDEKLSVLCSSRHHSAPFSTTWEHSGDADGNGVSPRNVRCRITCAIIFDKGSPSIASRAGTASTTSPTLSTTWNRRPERHKRGLTRYVEYVHRRLAARRFVRFVLPNLFRPDIYNIRRGVFKPHGAWRYRWSPPPSVSGRIAARLSSA